MTGLRHTRYTDHVVYRLAGAELRKARLEAGIPLVDMSHRLGLSAPGLHRNEAGKCRISLLLFIRYCRALGLRPGDVLDRLVGWIDESRLPEEEKNGSPVAGGEHDDNTNPTKASRTPY